jgi:hypothetical protein
MFVKRKVIIGAKISCLHIPTATYYDEAMKNPHAVALGRKGGKARAKNLTEKERSEAARKAVSSRWEKAKAKTA